MSLACSFGKALNSNDTDDHEAVKMKVSEMTIDYIVGKIWVNIIRQTSLGKSIINSFSRTLTSKTTGRFSDVVRSAADITRSTITLGKEVIKYMSRRGDDINERFHQESECFGIPWSLCRICYYFYAFILLE